MDNLETLVNKRLKYIREALKMRQLEFANAIGVRQSYYSEVETGKRKIGNKITEKLREKFSISSDWLYLGEGDMYITKKDSFSTLKAVPTLYPTAKKSKRGFDPVEGYIGLSENDLDYELSIEIEQLKEDYEAHSKLTQAIHSVKPPAFFIKKFPILKDFKEYKQEIEREFAEDHQHLEGTSFYKIFKIIELYQSGQEHQRRQLSTLIDYFHRYSDFFLDKQEVKDLLTE